MVPSASTWPLVISKLQRGADLMLPGVVLTQDSGNRLSQVEQGALCSVNIVGNRASVGVGVAMMSYDVMVASQWRGKGFKMLHLYGDHLWELGSKGELPVLTPQQTEPAIKTIGDALPGDCVGSLATASIEDQDVAADTLESDGLHLADMISSSSDHLIDNRKDSDPTESTIGVQEIKTPDEVTQDELTVLDGDSGSQPTPPSMDTSSSLLDVTHPSPHVLKGIIPPSLDAIPPSLDDVPPSLDDVPPSLDAIPPSLDANVLEGTIPPSVDDTLQLTGATPPSMDDLLTECFYMAIKSSISRDDLPVLTSTFYRSHVMPQCPQEFSLDVKKSKYKKLSKFLSTMQEEGVLKIKETSKGVETITDIDFKHPNVKKLVQYYTIPRTKTVGETTSSAVSAASKGASGIPQMTVTELYMPSRKTLPIFTNYGYSGMSMLTQSNVREVVTKYVKDNELVSPTNPRLVVLDPVLTDSVRVKGEPPPLQLSWQEINSRLLDEMRPGYSVHYDGGEPVYKRTKLEPVRLTVVTRTGNKKATIVDNLDYFGVSPVDVVHQVQRVAAASATVNDVQSGRSTRKQVMVQGNTAKVIAKLLQDHHGVPLKYIEAVDKTKIPKTQKRPGGKKR